MYICLTTIQYVFATEKVIHLAFLIKKTPKFFPWSLIYILLQSFFGSKLTPQVLHLEKRVFPLLVFLFFLAF